MVNTVTAVRRVLVLASLSIALIVAVTLLSVAANAKASAVHEPANPVAGETWVPADNSTVYMTGTSKLVAYMVPPLPGPFTITNITFKVITGAPPVSTFYPATYTVRPDFSSAVVTATNFPFTTPGEQAQFAVTYFTQANPSATTAYATYNVKGVYQAYIPEVLNHYGNVSIAGNDPCSAGNASPLTDYTTVQDGPYKFYNLSVPTTATLFLTATNYPLPGQMQLRTYPSSGCATTGTLNTLYYTILPGTPSLTAYNISPGNYLARFSSDGGATSTSPFNFRWSYIAATGLNEPNNSACSAIGVNLNTQYQDYPEDNEDWFYFDIGSIQTINIAVNNYTGTGGPTGGQIGLYQQTASCGSLTFLGNAGFTNNSAVITTGNLAPARYFLRVYTNGGFNIANLYNFTISSVTAPWSPQADRCLAFNNCYDHANPDGSQTIYFRGAPGATEIDVNSVATGHLTCPVGSGFTDVINSSSSPSVGSVTPVGNKTYTGLVTGYYIIYVTFKRPGFTDAVSSFGLKVNCDFLAVGLSPWPILPPGTLATPPAALTPIGPLRPPAVIVTPAPLPSDIPEVRETPAP